MKVYCILSDGRVFQSKSPEMFSTVLKRQGINGTYVPFKVDPPKIGQAIQSLRILNVAGANVTVPFKESVIPYLDVLSEGANIIGAINTIVCKNDMLKGYNTNSVGIMDALSAAGYDPEGKSAIVFGTGGAARSAAFILNWMRTETNYISGRNSEKMQEIVKTFGGEAMAFSDLPEIELPVHMVINATSVSSDEESPELSALIKNIKLPVCELVLDLNYGREQNFWRELAQTNEARFMDGLSPLAFQARRTFALWTSLQVPPEDFLSALGEDI